MKTRTNGFIPKTLVALSLAAAGVAAPAGARADAAATQAEIAKTVGDVAREGTYLPLAPLTRAEIAELMAAFTGQSANVDVGLLDSVEKATEGNPLFLDELLRLLLQRGELGPAAAGAWVSTGSLPVPDTVREVIRRRVSRLPPETRDLLAVASVIGRELGRASLASLARVATADAGSRLEPALSASLLVAVEPASYRFSHVLVRETVYRDLPLARRAELHLGLAALLEARGDDALAEVAHHRLAALPAGDPVAAAHAAQRAASQAMSMLAFEDAAALLEQARGGLDAAGQLHPEQAFELQLMAGLGFIRASQGDRGRALCAAAAVEARRLSDGDRLARAALGYGAELMLAQNDATLIGLLEESLGALPAGASGTRAQVMARLAAARMPADDMGPPMALARDAVAMARTHGADPETLRRVLYFAGSAMADYGDPAERAAVNEEMVSLARAAGDKVQMLRGECRLVFDYLELGDVVRSQRAMAAYAILAHEFRQPRHLWPASMMRAMYATAQGRAEEARRLTDEARALAASDRDVTAASVLAWHGLAQVVAFERSGDADVALAEVARSVRFPAYERIAQTIIDVSRAMLLARFSDDAGELQRLLDVLPWESPFLRSDFEVVAGLAEAVAVAGDVTRARSVHASLLPYGDRVGSKLSDRRQAVQVLNAIRNAIVPNGVCVLLEPPVGVVLGGSKRRAADRLRALAEQAGFSQISHVARGSADIYELRR